MARKQREEAPDRVGVPFTACQIKWQPTLCDEREAIEVVLRVVYAPQKEK
jgi:hypothetical protein